MQPFPGANGGRLGFHPLAGGPALGDLAAEAL